MKARPKPALWRFDDFVEGAESETVEVPLDSAQVALWQKIYGPTAENVPAGLLSASLTKAYLKAFQPRPSGNIHAGQKLQFSGQKVAMGDRLEARVTCLKKELKKERRWVTFQVDLRSAGASVLVGDIVTIWAE